MIGKWLKGYIECCVSSGNWERFMNLCRHHRIRLWNIRKKEGIIWFCMHGYDYKKICSFVGKTHVIPHLTRRVGFPFWCKKAIRNWTFSLGIIVFLAVLRILSMFVWQINYEGQREYTKETLQQEVQRGGIYVGMLRKNLDCDRLEKHLREAYDNISWVSAEEKGCVLNVKIKEGNVVSEEKEEDKVSCHVVAPCDGVIQRIVTREGTAKVARGDAVKKGDVLILGYVDVADDSETIVARHGVVADGEIGIRGELSFESRLPIVYEKKKKTGNDMEVYTWEVNNMSVSLKNPLKWLDNSSNYDIINCICADVRFVPLHMRCKMTKRKYIQYEKETARYQEAEAKDILARQFASYLSQYQEKGMQIEDSRLQIQRKNDVYQAKGCATIYVDKMEERSVNSEELRIDTGRKEDDDGTGTTNS